MIFFLRLHSAHAAGIFGDSISIKFFGDVEFSCPKAEMISERQETCRMNENDAPFYLEADVKEAERKLGETNLRKSGRNEAKVKRQFGKLRKKRENVQN